MAGRGKSGLAEKKCLTCQFWDISSAKDKAGRVRKEIGAKCLWECPAMPSSYRTLKFTGIYELSLFSSREDGKDCPCWKSRSRIIKEEPLESGHVFDIILEETTGYVVRMLEGTFCPGVHLIYRENKHEEHKLTESLARIYGKACRGIKWGPVSPKGYDKTVDDLHCCLMTYMMYSANGYTEGPVRSILGNHFMTMREVYRRLVQEERD